MIRPSGLALKGRNNQESGVDPSNVVPRDGGRSGKGAGLILRALFRASRKTEYQESDRQTIAERPQANSFRRRR